MSYIVKSGDPFRRYTDPMPQQVNPRGLQPQNFYSASLAYFDAGGDFTVLAEAPPATFTVEVLFFGSDYPISVSGFQQYLTETFEAGSTPLAPLRTPITQLAFPLALIPPTAAPWPSSAVIIPTLTSVTYQQKLSGPTATNAVEVTGFPYFFVVDSHNLFATNAGNAGDFAAYVITLSPVLSGAVVTGPGAFTDLSQFPDVVAFRFPVILHEQDFTQQIADDGFVITLTLDPNTVLTLDVVGLWASREYNPNPPAIVGEARAAAPFSADVESAAPARPSAAEVSALLRKYLLKGKV